MSFLKSMKWCVRKQPTLEERAAKDAKKIKTGINEIMEMSYASMMELVDLDEDNEYTRLINKSRDLTDASMDLMEVYGEMILEMRAKQDAAIEKLEEISQQLNEMR